MKVGRSFGFGPLLAAGLCFSGCGRAAVQAPLPTAPPTPDPTVSVAFQVAVTAVPAAHTPTPTPLPSPTQSVPTYGPYLLLSPRSGPPVARSITVIAGRLPGAVPIQLVFTAGASSVSTTVWTGRRGDLKTSFSIPGSSAGTYVIRADYNGITYAEAPYRVISAAELHAQIVPGGRGPEIAVSGRSFIHGLRLLLIAYPLYSRRRPDELGFVRVGKHGRFRAVFPDRLPPGEYMLRAWSTNSAAAQEGQAYFEVVV